MLSTLVNSFLAGGDCHQLITFAINLDSDQNQQNVGPNLDPNCLTLGYSVPGRIFEKVKYEKSFYFLPRHI